MLRFYILCSDPDGFYRHFSPDYANLSPDEVDVVINTLSMENEKDLIHLCKVYNVNYHVTRSNGTPGRGKNSLLKIFLDSEYDYAVLIDGDDYLTPHGVELYKRIAGLANVPDAICLKHQGGYVFEGSPWEPRIAKGRQFKIDPENVDYEQTAKHLRQNNPDEDCVQDYLQYHKDFYEKTAKYGEGLDTHNRVVFYSKKAAEFQFCENTFVGEDILHFYNLKLQHMNGHIVVVSHVEEPCTYVYNRRDPRKSSIYKITKGFQFWNWMKDFNDKVSNLEEMNMVFEEPLPTVYLKYEEPPNLDDFGINGPCTFEKNGLEIQMPAHTCPSSIESLVIKYGRRKEK